MILREVYMSKDYRSDRVHGYYVRYLGDGIFRVFEAAAPTTEFAKKIGCSGPTIREYDTDGRELHRDLKEACIKDAKTSYGMRRFIPHK